MPCCSSLSVTHTHAVQVWDLRREKRVSQHSQRAGGFNALALARDQSMVITAGQERGLSYWDLRGAAPVSTVPACADGTGEATTIAVAHAHDLFVTGGTDSMVRSSSMFNTSSSVIVSPVS